MKEILLVGAGGFIGAALRYIASTWFFQFTRFGFPLGTFAVNFIGCTLLGIFVGLGLGKTTTLPLREFVAIGILGGFTTFSTFGLESFEMLQAGQF
jgi:CrcB protein